MGTTTISRNLREFLSIAENKVELFDFLPHAVVDRQQTGVEVYATDGKTYSVHNLVLTVLPLVRVITKKQTQL